MAKKHMTIRMRIKGTRAVLRSKKTPAHTKPGLQKYLDGLLTPKHSIPLTTRIKGTVASLGSPHTPEIFKKGAEERVSLLLEQRLEELFGCDQARLQRFFSKLIGYDQSVPKLFL
jgi:hypothetical protein